MIPEPADEITQQGAPWSSIGSPFAHNHLQNGAFTPALYLVKTLAIFGETVIVRVSNIDSLSIPRHGNLQVNSVQ
jgi:hypothetical protein